VTSGFILNQKVSSSQANGEYYLTGSYCNWLLVYFTHIVY